MSKEGTVPIPRTYDEMMKAREAYGRSDASRPTGCSRGRDAPVLCAPANTTKEPQARRPGDQWRAKVSLPRVYFLERLKTPQPRQPIRLLHDL